MKRILTILALSFVYVSVCAQEVSFKDLKKDSPVFCRLGIVAGANLSKFTSSDANKFGFTPGFNAGAAFNMRFVKRNSRSNAETGLLGFQPEVRYSMIGASNPKLKLSYVTIPLMFQVYPIKNLFIELGPQASFNFAHNPDQLTLQDGTSVQLSKLKANDLMVCFGIGYSGKGFSIGVRYDLGTSKIAGNLPYKNSVFELNVGYCFKLKKSAAEKGETISLD